MKITVDERDTYCVIYVEGSLTNENLHKVEEAIDRCQAAGKHPLLDFSKLVFLDSSCLGLILSKSAKARTDNIHMIIFGLSDEMTKLFTITKIQEHLTICESMEDSLDHLSRLGI